MGCIKSKEMVQIEKMAQQYVEVEPTVKCYIKNEKNNTVTQLVNSSDYLNSNIQEDNSCFNYEKKNYPKEDTCNPANLKKDVENAKRKFFPSKPEGASVLDNYKIVSKIGKGAFSSVFKVEDLRTKTTKAMKVIQKKTVENKDDESEFLKEVNSLMSIQNPYILKIYEYYSDELNYFLIVDYLENGELNEYSKEQKKLTEVQSQNIMNQLLSAVSYLHSNNLIHKDIKLENILIDSIKEEKGEKLINIKLVDFGISNSKKDQISFSPKAGLPYCVAPEVLDKKYTPKCDIWSCGVVLYILLTGQPPFKGKDKGEILENIRYQKVKIDSLNISSSGKDLLKKMLERDINARLTAEECLKHEWFTMTSVEVSETKSLVNLSTYNPMEKLQQSIVKYIAYCTSSKKSIELLKKIFKKYDKNNDEYLSYDELYSVFKLYFSEKKCSEDVIRKSKLQKVLKETDREGSGKISEEQCLKVVLEYEKTVVESGLKMAFEKYDKKRDNKISKEELKNVLSEKDYKYVNEIVKLIEKNRDDYLSFGEFKELIDNIVKKKEKVKVTQEVKEEQNEKEDSFVYIRPEKKANLFDREKFLKLVDKNYKPGYESDG